MCPSLGSTALYASEAFRQGIGLPLPELALHYRTCAEMVLSPLQFSVCLSVIVDSLSGNVMECLR